MEIYSTLCRYNQDLVVLGAATYPEYLDAGMVLVPLSPHKQPFADVISPGSHCNWNAGDVFIPTTPIMLPACLQLARPRWHATTFPHKEAAFRLRMADQLRAAAFSPQDRMD